MTRPGPATAHLTADDWALLEAVDASVDRLAITARNRDGMARLFTAKLIQARPLNFNRHTRKHTYGACLSLHGRAALRRRRQEKADAERGRVVSRVSGGEARA